jgi:hypothetical protein
MAEHRRYKISIDTQNYFERNAFYLCFLKLRAAHGQSFQMPTGRNCRQARNLRRISDSIPSILPRFPHDDTYGKVVTKKIGGTESEDNKYHTYGYKSGSNSSCDQLRWLWAMLSLFPVEADIDSGFARDLAKS